MKFSFLRIHLSHFIPSLMIALSSGLSMAADFSVPSLSRCLTDMQTANTKDARVYNIYSDFYYEYEDKRDFAVAALAEMTKLFAPANSSCNQFSQPMNRETITCKKIAGSDVCIVPSDAGEFILVKDYVDSTNIILTEYDGDYSKFPEIDTNNDNESLWVPMPEMCYDGILNGLWDSQSYLLDAKSYRRFGDLRYVMARTSRDLVKGLSQSDNTCQYETAAHLAAGMQCFARNNKPTICGLPTTGAGYFIFVTDADNTMHLVFNRWD
ncbi:hypothetical protein [Aliikangiella sp. G2MR2-5]|uniref:hypothetical protein n=1 Tax=Aliikangiella sp. G2MR2-5 TaxID=2788943 RepID=UPI0018AC0BBE|nr:hypothetical protein [Aliikangiella sp. G2MR2-5]